MFWPFKLTDRRGGGRGGDEEPNHATKKAWPSVNCSVLSGTMVSYPEIYLYSSTNKEHTKENTGTNPTIVLDFNGVAKIYRVGITSFIYSNHPKAKNWFSIIHL